MNPIAWVINGNTWCSLCFYGLNHRIREILELRSRPIYEEAELEEKSCFMCREYIHSIANVQPAGNLNNNLCI